VYDSIQIEKLAAEWLARQDCGSLSGSEQVALNTWLDASTAHHVAYIRLQAAWRQTRRLKALAAGKPVGELPQPGEWHPSVPRGRLLLAVSETPVSPSRTTESSEK